MLTLKELQEDEKDFHIPLPGATRPNLGGMRPHLGATRPRVGICLSRLDALTSKYKIMNSMHCQLGGSNPKLAIPTRGRVAPK